MANYESVANLKPELVMRGGLNSSELEWLYGYTNWTNGETYWGLPRYKISLWSGQTGTGKSRLARTIASGLAISQKAKTLYFQNEEDLNTFAGGIKNREDCHNIYCSDETSVVKQVELIKELRPSMVFIDSVNELDEFGSGAKANIKQIVKTYREATLNRYCDHIILLGQLNQDGTIKGSTTLPHLVDIAFNLNPVEDDGSLFTISVGIKHRCGRKGEKFTSTWKHLEDGVKCISSNRLHDEIWCNTNNIPVKCENNNIIFPTEELEEIAKLERESPAIEQPKITPPVSTRKLTNYEERLAKEVAKGTGKPVEKYREHIREFPREKPSWLSILLGQD